MRVSGGESPVILVGKVLVPQNGAGGEGKFHDASLPLRHNENGIIDSVMITKNQDGRK